MLVDKSNILTYIPQRAPFIMVDELLDANEKGFKSQFRIEENNLFLTDGTLSESSLTENIAQTCAAGFGYLNSQAGKGEGQIGFIGAISKLENNNFAKLGDLIETEIEILNTFDSIHLVEGKATRNGEVLLKCQMKIVLA